jgi:hypothetical protein
LVLGAASHGLLGEETSFLKFCADQGHLATLFPAERFEAVEAQGHLHSDLSGFVFARFVEDVGGKLASWGVSSHFWSPLRLFHDMWAECLTRRNDLIEPGYLHTR